MKKLASFLLAMVLCLSLAACGGPDKQPAIDAQSRAAKLINELGSVMNEAPEIFADYIAELEPMGNTLNECSQELKKSLTQEELDEWVAVCDEIYQRASEIKDSLEN